MTLQFEIRVYKDLIERYPDWENLKKYLPDFQHIETGKSLDQKM